VRVVRNIHRNILSGPNGDIVEAAVGTYPYLWAVRPNDDIGALL